MEIDKESVVGLHHGHCTVGVVKKQLTNLDFKALKGILLRCPGANDPVPNTDCVWIGTRIVTADNAENTGGICIPPGEGMFIPIESPAQLYVISTAEGQDISWMSS